MFTDSTFVFGAPISTTPALVPSPGQLQLIGGDKSTGVNLLLSGPLGFANALGVINFTNGSSRFSSIGPFTGPDSGVSFYGTNAGSANALTSLLDLTGVAATFNVPISVSASTPSTFSGPVTLNSVGVPVANTTWAGTNMVVDMFKQEVEFTMTNDLTFAYATNLAAGVGKYANIYLYNGGTNRSVIFPANWVLWGCTATNTAVSNRWTAVYIRSSGTSQTNVWAKLEVQ